MRRLSLSRRPLFRAELIIHALINVKHILPHPRYSLPPPPEPGRAGVEGEGEGAQRDRASREGGQKEVAARFQIQKRQRFDEDFMEAVTKPVPQSEGGHCV